MKRVFIELNVKESYANEKSFYWTKCKRVMLQN